LFIGLLLFLFMLFPADVSIEASREYDSSKYGVQVDNRTHGGVRCVASHCLCRVRPGAVPDPITSLIPGERRISIYFTEDSSQIISSQETKIQSIPEVLSQISSRSITLVGYTDGCGGSTHNSDLARRRIDSVRREISEQTSGIRISNIVAGEGSRSHDPEARRVDIIIHTNRQLTTRIEKVPADVYLIDSSGSMQSQWRRWTDIINASFEPGGRIYLSTAERCFRNRSLDRISPGGGTEIWYSYWKVLDYMSPGETLLIISDFDSDIRLTRSESEMIRRKVVERQVIVRTLRP
jgi:hypothetical protein